MQFDISQISNIRKSITFLLILLSIQIVLKKQMWNEDMSNSKEIKKGPHFNIILQYMTEVFYRKNLFTSFEVFIE